MTQQSAFAAMIDQCFGSAYPDLKKLSEHLDQLLAQAPATRTLVVTTVPPAPGTSLGIPLPYPATQENLASLTVLYRAEDGKTYGESSGHFTWFIEGSTLQFTVKDTAPIGEAAASLDLWLQMKA